MPQGQIYDRQEMIRDLKVPQIASVVGCGGTGFWTAYFLAMSGVQELILIDADIIEISNMNRLPIESEMLGLKKTSVLYKMIRRIRKDIRIEIHDMRLDSAVSCQALRGVVFCCTDNLKSQQLICAHCKKNALDYQRIGYDGTILNVSKSFPLSFEEEVRDGYQVTPSWVVPAVLAAAAGVSSKLYKEISLMEDMGNLHMQGSAFICPNLLKKTRDEGVEEGEENILENINEHIPDSYGYCDDCERVETGGDYNYCPDCERVDEREAQDAEREGILKSIEGNYANSEVTASLEIWAEKNSYKKGVV